MVARCRGTRGFAADLLEGASLFWLGRRSCPLSRRGRRDAALAVSRGADRTSIIARNQLESPWPVPGSVLVKDGFVYALAGRSAHLDGGIYFVKLDALTGEPKLTKQIYLRDDVGRQDETHVFDAGGPGYMDISGLLYDIPSSIGSSIFVRGTRLSLDGTLMHDQPERHLFNPGGFLDDTWWHRFHMVHDARFLRELAFGPNTGSR